MTTTSRESTTRMGRAATRATDLVVVGQVLQQGRQAAHALQRSAVQRKCAAQAETYPALHHAGRQHRWQKAGRDAQGLKPRPQTAAGGNLRKVRHGYKAHGMVSEAGGNGREIAGAHADVGVVDDQHLTQRMRHHLHQRADLTVGAEPLRARQHAHRHGGELRLQLSGHRLQPAKFFSGATNANQQLKPAAVALAAVTAKGIQQAGVKPLDGLKHGNRWQHRRCGRNRLTLK